MLILPHPSIQGVHLKKKRIVTSWQIESRKKRITSYLQGDSTVSLLWNSELIFVCFTWIDFWHSPLWGNFICQKLKKREEKSNGTPNMNALQGSYWKAWGKEWVRQPLRERIKDPRGWHGEGLQSQQALYTHHTQDTHRSDSGFK